MTQKQRILLALTEIDGGLTALQLADRLRLSERVTRVTVSEMARDGLIVPTSATKREGKSGPLSRKYMVCAKE